jgi:hypothetical protein
MLRVKGVIYRTGKVLQPVRKRDFVVAEGGRILADVVEDSSHLLDDVSSRAERRSSPTGWQCDDPIKGLHQTLTRRLAGSDVGRMQKVS